MAPIENLGTQQAFALIEEMSSARNLLGYGTRVVRTAQFIDTTRDPILTMLSIGVEKLLKMALGLTILDETGAWPSRDVMRDEFRHGLLRMDAALREKLRDGIVGKEYEPYIRGVLEKVENDPVWPAVLAALDMYGQSGRFYFLDQLGSAPQNRDSPDGYWDAIEQAALANPVLRTQFDAALASGDSDEWDAFIVALNGTIADSVTRWWEMIAILGRHGVLGTSGKVFGFEVHPDAVGTQ